MSNSNDNTMEVQIGQRIKRARLEAAITQQELGTLLGRSSQQIHKYEQGTNRVSAGTLYTIARALDRSLDWFFSGVDAAVDGRESDGSAFGNPTWSH